MRSPCAGDALDPPLWKELKVPYKTLSRSLSLSLSPDSDEPEALSRLRDAETNFEQRPRWKRPSGLCTAVLPACKDVGEYLSRPGGHQKLTPLTAARTGADLNAATSGSNNKVKVKVSDLVTDPEIFCELSFSILEIRPPLAAPYLSD
jgi:hypothetical protein